VAEQAEEASDRPVKRRPGRPRLEAPSEEYVAKLGEILDAAIDVFWVRGYAAATLEDVAQAVDLRPTSLYHYVPSKAHLLYLILDRAISTALSQIEEYLEIEDPGQRLVALLTNQMLTIAAEPRLFKVFFEDRPLLDERYESEILAKERRYLKEIRLVVQDAIRAGVLPPVDPAHATQLIVGMSSWHYKWFDPSHHDAPALLASCLALLLRSGA
jgi:AcrR family transcriptional regulator